MSAAASFSSFNGNPPPGARLSYKFQRVREQIRCAIHQGLFSDRLPGERALAKRFSANAKTINKALNDLCEEGLLVRRIGSGTFVGNSPAAPRLRLHGHNTCVCLTPSSESPLGAEALLHALQERFDGRGHHIDVVPSEVNASVRSDCTGHVVWPAAIRSATSVVIVCPPEPLSSTAGQLGPECLLDAHRRQVPVISMGANSPAARVHSVVPDYFEAGFRTAQHLLRCGAERIRVLADAPLTPEAHTALNGCYSAVLRLGLSTMCLERHSASALPACAAELFQARNETALLCLGGKVLDAAAEAIGKSASRQARSMLAGILEPGDPTAERQSVTAFEFPVESCADWVAKLAFELRPGLRPIGLTIPGTLEIRA